MYLLNILSSEETYLCVYKKEGNMLVLYSCFHQDSFDIFSPFWWPIIFGKFNLKTIIFSPGEISGNLKWANDKKLFFSFSCWSTDTSVILIKPFILLWIKDTCSINCLDKQASEIHLDISGNRTFWLYGETGKAGFAFLTAENVKRRNDRNLQNYERHRWSR